MEKKTRALSHRNDLRLPDRKTTLSSLRKNVGLPVYIDVGPWSAGSFD